MTLSKKEIIDLASRYVTPEETGDFPLEGDLFCFIERDAADANGKQEHEGWRFSGYALCTGYEHDVSSKPEGKWLLFSFLSLTTFPPSPQCMKLQPPHIVKGQYHSPDRSKETRMLRISNTMFITDENPEAMHSLDRTERKKDHLPPDNIIQFPGGKR